MPGPGKSATWRGTENMDSSVRRKVGGCLFSEVRTGRARTRTYRDPKMLETEHSWENESTENPKLQSKSQNMLLIAAMVRQENSKGTRSV